MSDMEYHRGTARKYDNPGIPVSLNSEYPSSSIFLSLSNASNIPFHQSYAKLGMPRNADLNSCFTDEHCSIKNCNLSSLQASLSGEKLPVGSAMPRLRVGEVRELPVKSNNHAPKVFPAHAGVVPV